MILRYLSVAQVAAVLFFLSACGGGEVSRTPVLTSDGGPGVKVPEWVLRTPQMENSLCAVGSSEPTYYRDDAKLAAAESARKELARSLSIEVNTVMIDFATEGGESLEEGSAVRVSSWATDEVLNRSVVIEYWFDSTGVASGGKENITYALACMDKRKKSE